MPGSSKSEFLICPWGFSQETISLMELVGKCYLQLMGYAEVEPREVREVLGRP